LFLHKKASLMGAMAAKTCGNKKSPQKVGEFYFRKQRFSRPIARPSFALIKENIHYGQRVRDPHRGKNAFVRQTTPHFGGTLREGLYSVRGYHTPWGGKSK
jgi:hypothetical protein